MVIDEKQKYQKKRKTDCEFDKNPTETFTIKNKSFRFARLITTQLISKMFAAFIDPSYTFLAKVYPPHIVNFVTIARQKCRISCSAIHLSQKLYIKQIKILLIFAICGVIYWRKWKNRTIWKLKSYLLLVATFSNLQFLLIF